MTDQELGVAFDPETFEIPPDVAKLLSDIDALETMSNEGEAVNEAAMVLGKDIKMGMDIRRIGIGRIVMQLEPRYGEQTVRNFATKIESPYSTVTQYAGIVGFYGANTCVFYLTQTPVGYAVMRALKISESYGDSIKLLERARAEVWTESQSYREVGIVRKALGLPVKDPAPKTLYQTHHARIVGAYRIAAGTRLVIEVEDDVTDLAGIEVALNLIIKENRKP